MGASRPCRHMGLASGHPPSTSGAGHGGSQGKCASSSLLLLAPGSTWWPHSLALPFAITACCLQAQCLNPVRLSLPCPISPLSHEKQPWVLIKDKQVRSFTFRERNGVHLWQDTPFPSELQRACLAGGHLACTTLSPSTPVTPSLPDELLLPPAMLQWERRRSKVCLPLEV